MLAARPGPDAHQTQKSFGLQTKLQQEAGYAHPPCVGRKEGCLRVKAEPRASPFEPQGQSLVGIELDICLGGPRARVITPQISAGSSRAGAVRTCHHSLIIRILSPMRAPLLILRISLSQAVTPRPGQLTLEAAVHRGPQTGGGPQQREKRPGHRRHQRSSRMGAASEILH